MLRAGTHAIVAFLLLTSSLVLGALFFNRVGPETARTWQFGALYVLLFIAVYAASFLAGLYLRIFLSSAGHRAEFLRSASRQAVGFAFLAVIFLLLSGGRILNAWITSLLLVIFLLIELYLN